MNARLAGSGEEKRHRPGAYGTCAWLEDATFPSTPARAAFSRLGAPEAMSVGRLAATSSRPSFVGGVEVVSETFVESDEVTSSALYAGPSIAYADSHYWLSFAVTPQVAGCSSGLPHAGEAHVAALAPRIPA